MKIYSPNILPLLDVSGSLTVTGSINTTGDIVPSSLDQNLGSLNKPWKELFLTTGSIKFVDGGAVITSLTTQNIITTGNINQFLATGTVSGSAQVDINSTNGTLNVNKGGTGTTSLSGVLVGNGTSAFTTKTNPTGDFVGTSDTQTLTSKTLTGYKETVFAITDAATVTPTVSNGNIQTWTLGANRTLSTSSLNDGESLMLVISTGGASRSITWTTVSWMGGSAPTLQTTGVNVVELWKVGSTTYGSLVGKS
jgi:hypothetical protein